jgi:hypothetical protein
MFDSMTVGAQDRAFFDFFFDPCNRESEANHISNVEIFFFATGVVKLQRSEVVEATPFTKESCLVLLEPTPQLFAAFTLRSLFALLALPPTIRNPFEHTADFELCDRLRHSTIPTSHPGRSLQKRSHHDEFLSGCKKMKIASPDRRIPEKPFGNRSEGIGTSE